MPYPAFYVGVLMVLHTADGRGFRKNRLLLSVVIIKEKAKLIDNALNVQLYSFERSKRRELE